MMWPIFWPGDTDFSNPANGRGASIGLLHALTLRDQLRATGLDDPAFADAFHTATAETVEPWYRATLATDRHRLGEIEADLHGAPYDPPDERAACRHARPA